MLSSPSKQVSLAISELGTTINQEVLFDQLNLTLTSGQIAWVSGKNGCGKSTFLKVVSGLTEADHGQILWCDEPIQTNTHYHANRNYIAHRNGLKDHLTAIENIFFYLKLYQTQIDDIEGLLLRFDLLEYADTLCRQLSFGQQRRLALCRLEIVQSKLWILDEPYTGLDKAGQNYITSLCLHHIHNGGILIFAHHGELPQEMASNVYKRVEL